MAPTYSLLLAACRGGLGKRRGAVCWDGPLRPCAASCPPRRS